MALRTRTELWNYLTVQGLIDVSPDDGDSFHPTPEGIQVMAILLSYYGAAAARHVEEDHNGEPCFHSIATEASCLHLMDILIDVNEEAVRHAGFGI